MDRKLIILGTCIVSGAIGALVYRQSSAKTPKELSAADDGQASVQDPVQHNTACADDSQAWQRVRELEAEISRLKKASSSITVDEVPSPVPNATEAVSADSSHTVASPTHAPIQLPGAAPAGTVSPQWERTITRSTNGEEEDRALLKKLDLPNPDASMAAARRVPDERIHQLQGAYQGKLFFNKGSVGSLEVYFNLEEFGGKPRGTLNAKIMNEEGKTISNTRGEGSSIELKKIDGSDALLLKLSPFEIIQIFVKDDKTNLVGNYYERATEGEPLKKSAEFIITKMN